MRLPHMLVGTAVAMALLAATPAGAIDLTGTWEGKQTCQIFFGEKLKLVFDDDIMLISQSGTDINMSALNGDLLNDGKVIDDLADPEDKGQGSFIECGTTPANDNYSEIGRIDKLVIKPNRIGATFTATSIYSQPDGVEVGTCKWKYTRIDIADPGVSGCPVPPLSTSGPAAPAKRRSGKPADFSEAE